MITSTYNIAQSANANWWPEYDIAFTTQLTGRIGYDWGGQIMDAHYEDNWYFYDLRDLGAAALGQIRPGTIQPKSTVNWKWPAPFANTESREVSGACFDEQKRTLYVYMTGAIDAGNFYRSPVIHAYYVKKDGASVALKSSYAVITGQTLKVQCNSFNPAVTIAIDGALQETSLRIYAITGRLIADLSDAIKSGTCIWERSRQPPGIYVVEAGIGSRILTKQITLMK